MVKKITEHLKHASKGQSFLELSLVIGLILFLLVGMFEFGFLLNNYIGVVDAAREGARFASNDDPFHYDNPGWTAPPCGQFEDCIDQVIEGNGTSDNKGAIAPLSLDPATDDVIVTYYSVTNNKYNGGSGAFDVLQFPTSYKGHNYWCKYCFSQSSPHTPQIQKAYILNYLASGAPSTGLVVVEVFYEYHQVLKLPLLSAFDPIKVHTFSIMPLSAAEPTATPCPGGPGTC
jgi:thiol-disulfide isomerase/thioredoxin